MPAPHAEFPNLRLFDHPVIQHKLAYLRDRTRGHRGFRSLLYQIAGLMVYEVTRTFPTEEFEVDTPLERMKARRLAAPITVVPVLRSGLGMTEGIMDLIPEARVVTWASRAMSTRCSRGRTSRSCPRTWARAR